MKIHPLRKATSLLGIALCLVWLVPPTTWAQQKPLVIHVTSELVLVNFTAKDKDGQNFKGLKPDDITLLEDGKPQHISSLDFQDVDQPLQTADTGAPSEDVVVTKSASGSPPAKGVPAAKTAAAPAPAKPAPATAPSAVATKGDIAADDYKDRRLVVLYFDLTTMQPEDMENVVEQAQNYVKKQMQPADLVSIVFLGNILNVAQDFTADKDKLLGVLDQMNPSTSEGFSDTAGDANDGTDVGASFSVDDSEFDIANADRSLEALQSLGDMLKGIQQKKSVMFYASGIQRSGLDNEVTLRQAVNSLVKANATVYSIDARGLQVRIAGGSANTASTKGTSQYTGAGAISQLQGLQSAQETMSNIAIDTGGETFFDSNDFAPAYTKMQKDSESYYMIGFRSTNAAKDGKYRKLQVIIKGHPELKVAARPGYYAGKDISHLNTADRQGQLIDQLEADVPEETLPVYANDGYLRMDKNRYFIPVAVAIPGNAIPLAGPNPKVTPSIDIDGMVRDKALRQLGHIQQTISLNNRVAGGDIKQIQNKNFQYDTGFTVPPGSYEIRLAARENQVGQMGAFAHVINIPDLDTQELKVPTALSISSVLIGNQLSQARPNPEDPLTATGQALVPSVTHVFATNQPFYVYYEIYDGKANASGKLDIHTNVAFYRGKIRVFQTDMDDISAYTDPARKAAVVQLKIPLSALKPGTYTCQVNAVDENSEPARMAFPRVPFLVRMPPATAAAAPAGGSH